MKRETRIARYYLLKQQGICVGCGKIRATNGLMCLSCYIDKKNKRIIKASLNRKTKRITLRTDEYITHGNEIDFAYIAGIIDGEGCILLGKNNKGYCINIVVSMTNKKVIEKLSIVFPVNSINYRPKTSSDLPQYRWKVNGKKAYITLKKVFPYLIGKKEQAKTLIDYYEKMEKVEKIGIHKTQYSEETKLYQFSIYKQLRELKKYGGS